jgi:hypothetical protein
LLFLLLLLLVVVIVLIIYVVAVAVALVVVLVVAAAVVIVVVVVVTNNCIYSRFCVCYEGTSWGITYLEEFLIRLKMELVSFNPGQFAFLKH